MFFSKLKVCYIKRKLTWIKRKMGLPEVGTNQSSNPLIETYVSGKPYPRRNLFFAFASSSSVPWGRYTAWPAVSLLPFAQVPLEE